VASAGEPIAEVVREPDGAPVNARPAEPLAVIVGAGPGMGRAVAERFGREGFRVALLARRGERLKRVTAALTRAGVNSVAVEADAGDPKDLRAAIEGVIGAHGDPRVLIYNAASAHAGRPSTLDLAVLTESFMVNVGGLLTAAQVVLPSMRDHGRGTILATGSGVSLDAPPEETAAAVGKSAARTLLHALAKEAEIDGIHVAVVTVMGNIAPGTPFTAGHIAETFWSLHSEPSGAWSSEVLYTGRI
jgi:short-subunit dehydrogenase